MSEKTDIEIWDSIPFEQQFEIDMAIQKGNKVEAISRCRVYGKGFTLFSAQKFVEKRLADFKKHQLHPKA